MKPSTTGDVADLDLRFEPSGQGYKVSAQAYPEGGNHAILRPPFPWAGTETMGGLPAGAARHARPGEAAVPLSPRACGEKYFLGAFPGDLRHWLEHSLNRASRDRRTLRLRLHLGKASDLGRLPWEYLFDPVRGKFLAQELSIVRHLDGAGATKPLPPPVPLRVLAVYANPPGTALLAGDEEKKILRRALGPRVDFLATATMAALRAKLAEKRYSALHFIGHGAFLEDGGEGALVFEEAAGGARPVAAHRVATLLGESGVRLVVLNACEGARFEADPWSGVAQEMLRQGVPAVVAMQTLITDRSALFFAERFYESLAVDGSIDRALTTARRQHYVEHGDGEWGTPVFYTTAREPLLFTPPTLRERGQTAALRRPRRVAAAAGVVVAAGLAAGVWAYHDPWPPSPECPSPPGIGMRFRLVEGGKATLGSGKRNEAPRHEVDLGRFCIGQMEVTRGQWRRMMRTAPGVGADDLPVAGVSSRMVQSFLASLDALDGKGHYRLPSEDEWEFAARAGSADAYSFGDDEYRLGEYANCEGRAGRGAQRVASLKPNANGLFDMSGNVREWVSDARRETDGTPGAVPAEQPYIRGGGFRSSAANCRLAARQWSHPDDRSDDLGFRVVRDPLPGK